MTETTLALARFWGLLTLLASAVFFLRPSVLLEVKRLMVQQRPFALLYGLLTLVVGVASVALHNRWDGWLPGVVSLFGWLCLLKGIIVLAWPEVSQGVRFEARVASTRIALAIVSLLAAWLLFASARA